MGFKDPQRIINKEFDAYIKGGNAVVNTMATTTASMRKTIMDQKKLNQQMQDKLDQNMQSMYAKSNEFGSTGSAEVDESILNFWNQEVDNYFQIKNAMHDGSIGRQEGNRALAKIQGLVPQFKSQVAYLASESVNFQKDVEANNVSSVGSIENKIILDKIQNGNVQIVERGGTIYYYSPEEKDEEGNVLKQAAMLNGKEVMSMSLNDQSLYQTKPNVDNTLQAIYNKQIKPDSLESGFVEYVPDIIKGSINPRTGMPYANLEDGKVYTFKTIKSDKKPGAIEAIKNSPGISTLVNNENMMRRVWQDEIKDGKIEENGELTPNSIAAISKELGYDTSLYQDAWHEFATDMPKEDIERIKGEQNEIMKVYLSRKAYDNSALEDDTLKMVKSEDYNPNNKQENGEPYYMRTLEDVYDFMDAPIENQNLILNSTVDGKTVNVVSVNPDTGFVELFHTEYTVGEEDGQKKVNQFLGSYNPKDPTSVSKLASQIQRSIGGSSIDNLTTASSFRDLYPAYAAKRKADMISSDPDYFKRKDGGFGGFKNDKAYQKHKDANFQLLPSELVALQTNVELAKAKTDLDEGKISKSIFNELEFGIFQSLLAARAQGEK